MVTVPGPKKKQQTGGYRKFHTENLHHFYYLIYDIKLMKSGRVRLTGRTAHMVELKKPVGKFEKPCLSRYVVCY